MPPFFRTPSKNQGGRSALQAILGTSHKYFQQVMPQHMREFGPRRTRVAKDGLAFVHDSFTCALFRFSGLRARTADPARHISLFLISASSLSRPSR